MNIGNKLWGFTTGIGLQYPFKANKIYIVPYLNGLIGADYFHNPGMYLNYGYKVGLNFSYRLKNRLDRNNYLILGLEYRHKFFTRSEHNNIAAEPFKLSPLQTIGINFAYAFD
ncbi:hypothetical protein LJC11_04895 [Bacteroidales bacterium OttesenSCG-928-I21]|nr:hypothetical protein [Bacteroidales bacterium OttesenSCG-928-I21]